MKSDITIFIALSSWQSNCKSLLSLHDEYQYSQSKVAVDLLTKPISLSHRPAQIEGQVDLGSNYIQKWFTHPQMVTHVSNSHARHRRTSIMIELNMLPLSITTKNKYNYRICTELQIVKTANLCINYSKPAGKKLRRQD